MQAKIYTISIDRTYSRSFGFSLIPRGLDLHEEKDTGIFVSVVHADGKAEAARPRPLRINDKILAINGKQPDNFNGIMFNEWWLPVAISKW